MKVLTILALSLTIANLFAEGTAGNGYGERQGLRRVPATATDCNASRNHSDMVIRDIASDNSSDGDTILQN